MRIKLIMAILLWITFANNAFGDLAAGIGGVGVGGGEGYVYASKEEVSFDQITNWYRPSDEDVYIYAFAIEEEEPEDGTPYWYYAKPADGWRFVGWKLATGMLVVSPDAEIYSTSNPLKMFYNEDDSDAFAFFEQILDPKLGGVPRAFTVYVDNVKVDPNEYGSYYIAKGKTVKISWSNDFQCKFSSAIPSANNATFTMPENDVSVVLSSLTISSGVTQIVEKAFYNCGLTDVYYEGTKAQWDAVIKGDDAFTSTIHWYCTATFNMMEHGAAPAAQTVYSGVANVLSAPATDPSAKGYVFGGWYADKECNSPFDFTAALSGDVTVYAKWTARENTITFNTGNKGVTPDEQKIITGGTIKMPVKQYVGNEYIEGWYTDAACTNPYDFSTPVNDDLTLFAKWAPICRATITTTGGNSDCIVTLKDANDQPANEQLIPGVYTLTVTPANGYSFSGSYTFTDRNTGASIMSVTISGTTTRTYELDLTNKDVDINVTFTTSPIVTISVTDDGNDVVYEYTLKDKQSTPVTYKNGDILQHVDDGTSMIWSPNHDLVLTITPGDNVGCTGTITNNGVKTAITADKTSYTFTPRGNIDISLYFYDKNNPAKYTITTDSKCAVYNADYWSEKTPLTKAPEGMELMIELVDGAQPTNGKYFTGEYTVNDVSLGRESEWACVNTFTMPAEAVKVVALQADKTVLKFDFSATGPQEVPYWGIILFNSDVRVSWTTVDDDYLVDFDGGGTPDMKWWYDASGHCYVEQLATADARGNFTFNYDDPTSCYSAITFYFPTVTKIGGTTITTTLSGYLVDVDDETQTGGVIDLTDGTGVELTSRRTLSAPSGGGDLTIDGQTAKLYTVCLPVDPKTSANVKYYELSGANAEGTGLLFDEVATPVKNTPYLVAVFSGADLDLSIGTATSTNVEQTVTNTSGGNGYTLKGTLKGLTNAEAVGKLILQSGARWGKVTSEKTAAYIPPMRGYVEGPASAARLMVSFFDNDNATGIEHIRTMDADGTERWYDLNGRQIDKPTKKGIYIHNGKKTTN